jgi:hypothetical protein
MIPTEGLAAPVILPPAGHKRRVSKHLKGWATRGRAKRPRERRSIASPRGQGISAL